MNASSVLIKWSVVLLVLAGALFAFLPPFLDRTSHRISDDIDMESTASSASAAAELRPDASFSTAGGLVDDRRPAFGARKGGLYVLQEDD